MLGEIDILVCGNSDPGTSGLLSPFAKIQGLYFNNEDEPDEFYYNLMKELSKKYKKEGIKFIQCEFDSANDFYTALKELQNYTLDHVQVSGTSREGRYEIVINDDTDLDDQTKTPSKEKEAKEKEKKES